MEVLEFLEGAQRMCNEYACYDGCPIYGACVFDGINAQSPERLEDIVTTVETWIETHPIKTNAQKFEEVFGFMPTDHTTLFHINKDNFGLMAIKWSEPYKEPEHED